MLWDRGFWMPDEETADVDAALRKGELKFAVAGEKLKGGWVLVRMKGRDGDRGKRNNWLLIKHRDEFACEDAEALLAEDRSVASGRTMEQIAAGKGRGAKPFMAAGAKAGDPEAIWHSNKVSGRSHVARQPSRLRAQPIRRSGAPKPRPGRRAAPIRCWA